MRITPIISETEFKSRFEAALSTVPPGAIRDYSFFEHASQSAALVRRLVFALRRASA